MKKITYFLFLLMFSFSWFNSAQVSVGTGTEVGKAIPIEPYYGYTYSQVIYTQAELGAAMTIGSIQYSATTATTLTNSNQWVVYVGHTAKTSFASTTDWVPFAELTQVYTGTVSISSGVVEITFTTPFAYNGVDNLVIAVDENKPSYDSSSHDFYCSAVADNRSLTYRNDSTNPDPASPPTATYIQAFIANIIFYSPADCPKPSGLTANNVAAYSADLAWTANGSESSWNIEIGESGFTQGSGYVESGVTNPYTFEGLEPETAYQYYVQADCGSGNTSLWTGPYTFTTTVSCPAPTALAANNVSVSTADLSWTSTNTLFNVEYGPSGFAQGVGTMLNGVANPLPLSGLSSATAYQYYVQSDCGSVDGVSTWAGPYSFTTACVAISSFPWEEGFESVAIPGLAPCWLKENGDWVVTNNANTTYDTDARTGTQFLRDSWSATNEYVWSPGFELVAGTSYDFSFWWAGDGYDVWQGEVFVNSSQSSVGSTMLGNAFIQTGTATTTDYTEVIKSFVPTTDGIYYFAIRINAPFDPWYLSFDDFKMDLTPSCSKPNDLTASNVAAYSADLSWVSTGSLFNVEWGTTGFVQGQGTLVNGVSNPYALSGLTPTTAYQFYVQLDCGSGTTSEWAGPYSFTTTVSCVAPTALAASNITSNSADLAWTSTNTLFNVQYGPTGFGLGNGTINSGVSNPYTLTNLSSGTVYQYYVQSDCGSVDGVSTWAGPYSFQTECETQSAPYFESFDTFLPSVCWKNVRGGDLTAGPGNGTTKWIADGFINNGSTGAAKINIYYNVANDWLISPKLNIPATGYEFLYKVAATQWNSTSAPTTPWEADDFVEVLISTSMTNWTVLTTYNSTNVPSATGDSFVFDLDAYAGQEVYFAFRAVEGTENGNADIDFFIDDFQIRMTPMTTPDCATNLVATPDAACGNNPSSLSWDVVNGVDGYHLTVGTSAGASDVYSGNVTANSYVVNTQNANTTYFWKVVPFNSFGDAVDCNEQSYTTFATGCYCASVPTSNDGLGITNVQLVDTDYAIDDVFYSDQTAGTVVDMPQGELINAQISFDTSIYDYDSHIWIDFNDNYTFESSELVYSGVSLTTSPNTLDASFTMPASANLGTHRMRIGTADFGQVTPNPCYSGSYGVTIDFNVNVVESTASLSDNVIDGFNMYPNPVTNFLNLNALNKIDNIAIYNMLGQEVLKVNPNQTQVQLDVNKLSSGSYIVKVKSGEQVGAFNLIKN